MEHNSENGKSSEISELKKEIKAKSAVVEEEKKSINEISSRLDVENEKISGEKAIVEKVRNEANETSAQVSKMKEEADKAFAEAEAAKIAAHNNIDSIKNDDLAKFKNQNKPSRNYFLIFKLFYLIFNPKEKLPGDDIIKELPNIKNKCLNLTPTQIKKIMIDRLYDISWITPEFLDKVKMYTEFPYTDPKVMKNISVECKIVVCYFHNLLNYKRLYDKYENFMKKSQKAAETAATSK